jgi:hypothetical protein
MIDTDTFLTTLYVMVDDFCKSQLPDENQPGRKASLSRSEVITLAVFSQWERFRSERDFYRYAQRHLREVFPTLPHHGQFNRLVRRHRDAISAFFLHLVDCLQGRKCAYEALDTSGVATRDCKRRGRGWLPGLANIGWSNRLGWYHGFHLLTSVNPEGIVTGFAFAPASAKDQPMAEAFFALRRYPDARLPTTGRPALGPYVADKGFVGRPNKERWLLLYGAQVISPQQNNSRFAWPKAWRRFVSSVRQIVETVYEKLHRTFRLDRERPHDLSGFQARLAAKIALHNFCIWLNEKLGRPKLAFADLVDW